MLKIRSGWTSVRGFPRNPDRGVECPRDGFFCPINLFWKVKDEDTDPVTIAEELSRAGVLEQIGGVAMLAHLQANTPATSNAGRYAHIVDPRTGLPVEGMAGVTVLCPTATAADALSTALFVAGMEGLPALLARLPECEVIAIPDRQPLELWVTDGIRPLLSLPPEAAILHRLP